MIISSFSLLPLFLSAIFLWLPKTEKRVKLKAIKSLWYKDLLRRKCLPFHKKYVILDYYELRLNVISLPKHNLADFLFFPEAQ